MQAMHAAMFHFNYGLMRRELRIMAIFMTTTAALQAGVLLLLTTCFLGRLIDKRSSRKAHRNLNGMRLLMQLRKLLFSKIYFMNSELIARVT